MSWDVEVAADAPRMWFKLDNSSGTATNYGSVVSPTVTEGAGLTKGASGNSLIRSGDAAYDFTGTSTSYVQLQDTGGTGQDFAKTWSFECIFKCNGAPGGNWPSLADLRDNSNVHRTSIGVNSSNFIFVDSQFHGTIYSGAALTSPSSVWQHLVVTQEASGGSNVITKIYVNGALSSTSSASAYSATNPVGRRFMIGNNTTVGAYGPITEWAVYPTTLSAARIAIHYTAALVTPLTVNTVTADSTFSGATDYTIALSMNVASDALAIADFSGATDYTIDKGPHIYNADAIATAEFIGATDYTIVIGNLPVILDTITADAIFSGATDYAVVLGLTPLLLNTEIANAIFSGIADYTLSFTDFLMLDARMPRAVDDPQLVSTQVAVARMQRAVINTSKRGTERYDQ
jgi:hypothetical protein